MLLRKSCFQLLLKDIDISQGSVTTHLRFGAIFSDSIITKFLLILAVKKVRKLVYILWSYKAYKKCANVWATLYVYAWALTKLTLNLILTLILALTLLLNSCNSEHSTKSHMSYVSIEIHTRQCCCTVCTKFDCNCHTGTSGSVTEWLFHTCLDCIRIVVSGGRGDVTSGLRGSSQCDWLTDAVWRYWLLIGKFFL